MRSFLIFALLVASVTPTVAQPAKMTGAEAKAICAEILENQDRSREDKRKAADLYFFGHYRGTRCIKSDYVRAITLIRESGYGSGAYEAVLLNRARDGSPSAISALQKFGYRFRMETVID